ncbi:succinylglutamate desuccinylase/aspartoacylase family protein [Gracilimonas mengyeensis]|nr:succinylglutamate desuccinylase/aspartoacylase family protein [Gracilimonas mengyeensis]
METPPDLHTDLSDIERVIWSHETDTGPVLVIFAGIHGNELAGIYACQRLSKKLSENTDKLEGSVYMISGNREAIKMGYRYINRDLNRIWNEVTEGVKANPELQDDIEWEESLELLQVINTIVDKHKNTHRDVYFCDLHTTSAQSCAFILFNDTLENRRSASVFPVPQILGIEESIHGTLLSFINDLGYPAIGFEAGEHNDPQSVLRTEAFLRLYLHFLNILKLKLPELQRCEEVMSAPSGNLDEYYEITYHHFVEDAREFDMKKGYQNFDPISKGDLLAYDHEKPVYAPTDGLIFMPLYQSKGRDGFFILKGRSPFWLEVSSVFRDSFLNKYLHFLPGVDKVGHGSFTVDLRVARFFVKEIFHLLGYRVIRKDEQTLVCYKR